METVVVEIRPAEGGDDAKMFTEDMLRVLLKYCARRGWRADMTSVSYARRGCKEIVFTVKGKGVSRLAKEAGCHRVQRVPPTDKKGRRQTSTITVAVLPLPKRVTVNLRDKDLRWETMRASGPGGQNVNKCETAVRVTHVPTGLTATAQTKSQATNKQRALEVLMSRLHSVEKSRIRGDRNRTRARQVGSGNRGDEKIRTIRYQDGKVTDHRSGTTVRLKVWESGDLDALLK